VAASVGQPVLAIGWISLGFGGRHDIKVQVLEL
jgi:hypothetical protein